jgi:Beta-lactamase class A
MSRDVAAKIDEAGRLFAGDDPGRSLVIRSLSPVTAVFSAQGDVLRPAASVMKLPFAMALLRKAAAGGADLEETMAVQDFPPTRYVSILAGLTPEHRLSLREILRLALITSDNPMAVILQRHVHFDEVNDLLDGLGLYGCRMAAGFTEDELGPKNRVNLLTAEAAVTLLMEASANPLYRDVLTGLENNLRNNRIAANLPDSAVVAHKTGSLNGVVNDAGLVRDGAIAFAIAFLTDAQADPGRTTLDIAACTASVYAALAG